MSGAKVPAGWAKPESPKPRDFGASLLAGLLALFVAGVGIAYVFLNSAETKTPPSHTDAHESKIHSGANEHPLKDEAHDAHGDHRKSEEHREPDDFPDDPNDPSAHDLGLTPKPQEDAEPEAPALENAAEVQDDQAEDPAQKQAFDKTLALDIDVLPIQKATEKWLTRANEHLKAERFRSAIFDFRRVLRIDKRAALAYRGIGIAYARLDKAKYARKAYEKYLELAPNAEDAPDVRSLLGQ